MIPNSLFVSENIIIPGTHSYTCYDGDVVSCCFIHVPVMMVMWFLVVSFIYLFELMS